MKNQLDLIISGTIFVIALVVAGAFFATKRQVTKPPAPTAPTLTAVKAPNPMPEMTNGLQLTTANSGARGGGPSGPGAFGPGGPQGIPGGGPNGYPGQQRRGAKGG